MEILLENLQSLIASKEITKNQALYLIYKYNGLEYKIANKQIFKLQTKGLIKSNKVDKSLLITTRGTVNKLTGSIIPKFNSDIASEMPKKLCKLFCVVNSKGTLHLPGGTSEDSVQYTATKYLQGEGLITYHYLILLYMFPLAGKTNRKWEKHFTKTEYKGPRLRLRSKVHGRKFKAIARKRDMGIFLYGTYLYVASCIQGSKSYITTVNKYLDEYEEWYNEAATAISNARRIEDLFRKKHNAEILTVL